MRLKSLSGRVLVKLELTLPAEEQTTASGIIIPKSHYEPEVKNLGVVLSKGDRVPDDIKVGDRIVCFVNAGLPVPLDNNEDIISMRYEDIVAVFTTDDDTVNTCELN